MYFKKNGVTYALPEYTSLDSLDFDVRTKSEPRAFSHGKTEIGDGKIDGRLLTLDIYLFGTSVADHRSQWDALQTMLMRQDQQLYLDTDRYINIARLDKIKQSYMRGFQGVRSIIKATLAANDPFFYSVTPVAENTTVTASPTTINITNTGNIDSPLIVTIVPTADCSSLTLTQTTDDNRAFSMADVQLVPGTTAIINAVTGTVYRDTSNAINTFSGSFLQLLPGVNSLTYTGGNCVITLGYTPRWI